MKLVAEPFATLPQELHYRGEPTPWVRMTRPGQRLHSFLESPRFDAEGALWLADVPYGRIFRVIDGRWEVARDYDGEPHGLAWHDGSLVVADYRLGLIHPGSPVETLVDGYNGEAFRGLSDLVEGPDGALWFTDPGRSSLADPSGRLLRWWDGRTELVLGGIPYPNGLAFSLDGAFLYLAVTRANAVWRLATATGEGQRMAGVFLNLSGGLGPDGLAVDKRGRIAVAQAQAGRAYLFDALGDPLATVHVTGGQWTTACAFGPDGALHIVEAEAGVVHRCPLEMLD